MKITYLIDGMYNSAGMERVVANKVNYLSSLGYNITILTTNQKNRDYFYSIPECVTKIDLDINFDDYIKSNIFIRLQSYSKKKVLFKERLSYFLLNNKQDILICLMTRGMEFLFDIPDGSKKICECHFNRYSNYYIGKADNRTFIQRIVYSIRDFWIRKRIKKFDRFVVLTQEDKKYWGNAYSNIICIPNSITYAKNVASLKNKVVLAVGRLNYQKGFDILLSIWALISPRFPDWKLHIYGSGEDSEKLEKLAKSLGIISSVIFFSPTQRIDEVFLSSSIFAFPSRFEGLPMVLLEAMNKGLPSVAFNCKCGPSDIIKNSENGFLCNMGDNKSFQNALEMLMSSYDLRVKMGYKANLSVRDYDHHIIMRKWDNLFKELLKS
ncbi:MAG: glycosyltransferase family 4 protein [Bacteroidales bacterium]|nr:glycosyltransferase family 4 protein [Bacteroidales bacterium]